MNKYLSDKLRILSFIIMILVVILHAYKPLIKFDSGNLDFKNGYPFFIQLFFSEGMARIAVPFFFFISGYLFFLNFNGSISWFLLKYRKRAKSLVVPYLLWSAWGLLLYFILQLFPQSAQFFTREPIAEYSSAKLLNTLLLNPIPYQLWFLRDLIVLVTISPFIYWMLKYFRITVVMLLFIIWLDVSQFSFVIFRNESILFFSLGAYAAITESHLLLKKSNQAYSLVVAFLWIVTIALKTTLIYQGSEQMNAILLLGKLSILSGSITVWSFYDIAMKNKEKPSNKLLGLSAFTFFIFGSHEPLLTLIQKGIFHFSGASELMVVVNYILAPAITILTGILLGSFLKRHASWVYDLFSGGR